MIIELLTLYAEFFKIGLLAVGGGLVTLPLLYDLSYKYEWFTENMISDMIAISESTPGPMGVNMATYVGFQNYGVIGAIIATLGLVTPSIIVILIVSKFLQKFENNPYVIELFKIIRPVVTGIIASIAVKLTITEIYNSNTIHIEAMLLFLIAIVAVFKFKKNPITYIAVSAVLGILIFQ